MTTKIIEVTEEITYNTISAQCDCCGKTQEHRPRKPEAVGLAFSTNPKIMGWFQVKITSDSVGYSFDFCAQCGSETTEKLLSRM